jgi:hypothetical protein
LYASALDHGLSTKLTLLWYSCPHQIEANEKQNKTNKQTKRKKEKKRKEKEEIQPDIMRATRPSGFGAPTR